MKTPTAITLTECAFTLDGGSVHLFGYESDGTMHQISLAQHHLLGNLTPDYVPGRIHLDGVAVPVRSDAEVHLIAVLRSASIEADSAATGAHVPEKRMILSADIEEYLAKTAESPAAAIALLVKRVVDFVASDEYIAVADKISTLEPYASTPKGR